MGRGNCREREVIRARLHLVVPHKQAGCGIAAVLLPKMQQCLHLKRKAAEGLEVVRGTGGKKRPPNEHGLCVREG